MFLIEMSPVPHLCTLGWVLASETEKYFPNCLSEGGAVSYVVCIIQSFFTLIDMLLAIRGFFYVLNFGGAVRNHCLYRWLKKITLMTIFFIENLKKMEKYFPLLL